MYSNLFPSNYSLYNQIKYIYSQPHIQYSFIQHMRELETNGQIKNRFHCVMFTISVPLLLLLFSVCILHQQFYFLF